MAREKIVRTSDGIQFAIETDEPYARSLGDVGELVRTEQDLSQAVRKILQSLVGSLKETNASKANISFGLALSPGGAFFITRGQSDSHIVVTLDFDSEHHRPGFES